MNSLIALLALSPLFAPANDNAAVDPCVACEEFAASRDGLCVRCDHDVMAHVDSAEEFPYDANDMGAADYFPGKF